MTLLPIQSGGLVEGLAGPLPLEMSDVLVATSRLYDAVGFNPPWICYLALQNGIPVGTCGFKSAPTVGQVEIAYFTFPQYEGRGVASSMVRELTRLVDSHDSTLTVTAQTLPDRNASHRVLEKLEFAPVRTLEHPEDGTVLEWQRKRPIDS